MKQYLKSFIKQYRISLVILLFPMVSYGLLGPLEIFFGNEKDFNFWYTDFYGVLVLISVVTWIVLALLVALLPQKIFRFVNSTILAVALASYIQNMFMNIKLSEADGSPMKWESLQTFSVINLAIWIAIVIAVVVVFALLLKKWNFPAMAFAGFFSAIQLVAVVTLLVSSIGKEPESNYVQMSGKDQFKVSGGENMIVFVLDTFGSGQLELALEQYPDMLDGMQDFTYYNNADCHYYCTFPSMTNMLTGINFDFQVPLSQVWLADAWNSERAKSFYETLHEDGYTCNLYSGETGYVYGNLINLEDKWDNICPMDTKVETKQLSKLMLKMSIYRYVPYVLKPHFEVLTMEFDPVVTYVDSVGVIDDNASFYAMLKQQSLSVDESMDNAFIVQHLFGTHLPYTLDENAMMVKEAQAEQTAKGLMVIVNEYLTQLKNLGLYEDANIIVTADHGSWYNNDTQPIFFLKKSGEKHERLQTNTAPISLDDFQATIMSLIGEDSAEYGTSVFEWQPGQERERTVYMRFTDDAYPDVPGSVFNIYGGYTYMTDREELNAKVNGEPDEVKMATPW